MLELNHLPDEILVEILSRLRNKTLIKCVCTCKWLLSFISGPTFMVAQMKKSAQNNPMIFLRYYSISIQKDYFSLQPDNDDCLTGQFDLIELPSICRDYYAVSDTMLSVVGSCNGVICLTNCFNNDIILWNPCIRKSIVFAGALDGYACGGDWVGLGFGFDLGANDFKVVRLVYNRCRITRKFKGSPVVWIYSVRLKAWRVVESVVPEYQISDNGYTPCFVSGAVHWPGWNGSDKGVVVVFNLEDEVFGEIGMPVCLADSDCGILAELKVGKCKDMLALIRWNSVGKVWSVWVMRDYGMVDSWCDVCHIDMPSGYPQPVAFGFTKTEEILVFVTKEISRGLECMHLILLVGHNGRVTKVVGMIHGTSCSIFVDTYVESLALFMEGRAMLNNKFPGYGPSSGEVGT